jgi:molybdopterin biosynthesis enzyme
VDARLKGRSELISILEATSRTVSGDAHSLSQTPVFDPSAIDGYAVASAYTRGASVEKPLALRVEGIIAAGGGSVRRFRDETDLMLTVALPML